jgi:hypothetical protein
MRRKVAAIPAWKEGQGHEDGADGEGEKRRLTFEHHEWRVTETSRRGNTPEEEQEEH